MEVKASQKSYPSYFGYLVKSIGLSRGSLSGAILLDKSLKSL